MESCEIEINDLPNEIIIKILRLLENRDLKTAILTCKFWKSIIESSCQWSLEVDCGDLNTRYNFLATTKRKFRSVELRGSLLVSKSSAVVDFFRRHGLSIVKLCLVHVWLNELATLVQILNCLPNLIELTVFGGFKLEYHSSDLVESELPVLPTLRTLRIFANADYRILKCLTKVKVKMFQMINFFSNCNSYHCDNLEEFLQHQDKLTTLALRSVYDPNAVQFCATNLNYPMSFQLTRLSLIDVLINDSSNLLKFIEQHSQSLKELELGDDFHHTIYECVFAKMTNLKKLNLMTNVRNRNSQMWGRLKKNRSIKTLILKETPHSSFGSRRFFRQIFKCLPNVTNLTVLGSYFPEELMEVVAENLTQLRMLHVSKYHADFRGIHFPNLTSLHIDVLNEKFDWQMFSRAHPKLTEFSLRLLTNVHGSIDVSGDQQNDPILEEIAKMTKANAHLHTLKFGEWFRADARSLEVLRMNCPQLKALNLDKNCAVLNEPYDQSWVNVLRFCENNFDLFHLQSSFWSGDDE